MKTKKIEDMYIALTDRVVRMQLESWGINQTNPKYEEDYKSFAAHIIENVAQAAFDRLMTDKE